jgi:hypothetical protein
LPSLCQPAAATAMSAQIVQWRRLPLSAMKKHSTNL